MVYELAISPLATDEIIEAFDWYESIRKGLGDQFLSELETVFNSLLQNPKTYSWYQKPVRSVMVKRFPYSVTYEIAGKKF
jgi:toxin ParE1/3/4